MNSPDVNDNLEGYMDLEELRRGDWKDEVEDEDVDGPSEQHRSGLNISS